MYSDGSQDPTSFELMTWSLKPAGLGDCAKYLKRILLTQEARPRQGRQPGEIGIRDQQNLGLNGSLQNSWVWSERVSSQESPRG